MKYRIRPLSNNLWMVSSVEQGVTITVRDVEINVEVKTLHEGVTNVGGITTYQGYLEFETEKPLTVTDSKVIIY